MKAFIVLLLFAGLFLVTHGVYEQKLRQIAQKTKIEYRFVPRSYYDEQLAEAQTGAHLKDMFQRESPWSDKTVGAFIAPPARSEPATTAKPGGEKPVTKETLVIAPAEADMGTGLGLGLGAKGAPIESQSLNLLNP